MSFPLSAARYFTTNTAIKPVFKIDKCQMYVKCVLLKEQILLQIERRLQSRPITFPFCADFAKTYRLFSSVETMTTIEYY